MDTDRHPSYRRFVTAGALFVGLLSAAPPARADAAADVRDIRAGGLPRRHAFLGWDGAGHAHLRTLACSTGGTNYCKAALVEIAPDAPNRVTTLLEVNEVYCETSQPCAALDKKTVLAFEAAEKKAMAALPALTMTPAAPDPTGALGPIAGEPTRVGFAVFPNERELGFATVQLVLRGKGGAMETLATLNAYVSTVSGERVVDARTSADGATAVFVATMETTSMCWDTQSLHAVGVNVARRRASLANTIGFREWKKSDMPAALAAFSEATREDATFALGWYNRAAVESRTGAVDAARVSFAKAVALDPPAAARACNDTDFRPLRAAEPTLFRCAGK